jgi:ribonuclease I
LGLFFIHGFIPRGERRDRRDKKRKIQDSKFKNVPGKNLAGFPIMPKVEYFELFLNLHIICAFRAAVRCLCRLI